MNGTGILTLSQGEARVVPAGPNGERVHRFDAPFNAAINLTDLGIDPAEYDLLTLQIKADRAAFLMVGLDNFPWRGQQARWYVLDGMRGPLGWKTIWIDLRAPEEGPRKAAPTTDLTLHLRGSHKQTGRSIQQEDRAMLLGPIRAVRKAIHLDWDQSRATQAQDENGALVASYPLTVINQMDEPVTANVSLRPFQARYANATLSQSHLELAPHEQATVRATLKLPAPAASKAQPLYAERFEAFAWIPGRPHTNVTILRSSDPIHLSITKPPAEETLQFPLLPRPSALPAGIVHFDPGEARQWASAAEPSALIQDAKRRGISNSALTTHQRPYLRALIASAYLYDYTGEDKYLDLAAALLKALPEIWETFYKDWQQQEARLISAGIAVRMGDRSHFTLRLGWRLMGTQRSPYQYSYDHNARGGTMSALFYAFDMVAADLDPELRSQVIQEFIVPAGIQCRNHYIGDGNQQATVNAVALYAGLAARNWPLVSFAYSSEHGLPGILEWTFDDDGKHIRDGYQTYTLRPVFWLAELLYGRGKNVYDVYGNRLRKAANHPEFQDRYFWAFAREYRTSERQDLPAPTNLTATSVSEGLAPLPQEENFSTTHRRLIWTDAATQEVGFKVERRRSPGGTFSTVATITGYVPQHAVPCPPPGETYSYRVRAFNYRDGISPPSNAIQLTCTTID